MLDLINNFQTFFAKNIQIGKLHFEIFLYI